MTIQISTGLRNKMLDTGSFRSLMNGGKLLIYAGSAPTGADAPATSAGGSLLCTITTNNTGTGLNFATSAASGVITKATADVWSGTNSAGGTPSFYRFVAPGDTDASSTTQCRIQGSCDNSGAADLNLTNAPLTSGALQIVDYFSVSLPTL